MSTFSSRRMVSWPQTVLSSNSTPTMRVDVGVVVHLAVFQAFQQRPERCVVEAVQVEDVLAERQALRCPRSGLPPDSRSSPGTRVSAEVLVHRHVDLLAHGSS